MKCRNCGKELKEWAPFCKFCGAPQPPQQQVPKAPKKGVGSIVAIAMSAVLSIGMVAGTGYYISNRDGGGSAEGELQAGTELVQGTAVSAVSVAETGEVNGLTRSANPLADEIAELNQGDNHQVEIDVDEENYEPGTRDYKAIWNSDLFYTLEDVYKDNDDDGQINNYNILQKEMINADTKNRIEYEIYQNPDNGNVNKIVSIEYVEDQLEVTEYYYDDDHKVNFVFTYKDTNYFPSYATPDRDGERYYFNNDCMVKWRIVEDKEQTNYVIGKNQLNEGKGSDRSTPKRYKTLSDSKKAEYDENEKRMIDQAYNTYNKVLNAEGISLIQGYVYDDGDSGVADTTVSLLLDGEESYLYNVKTDSSGLYTIYVPAEQQTYWIRFGHEGYENVDMYEINTDADSLGDYQTAVYMIEPGQKYSVDLFMRDAINYASDGSSMMSVEDVDYAIRRGINCRSGEVVDSGQSGYDGSVQLELDGGSYTIEISKSGYAVSYYSLIVGENHRSTEFFLSPQLEEGEVRIVLNWSDTPRDLDSHLFTPYCETQDHVCFYKKEDSKGNMLDVDDTDGRGPETVTIVDLEKTGLYKYYVADYTNCSDGNYSSYQLSNSDATVRVYTDEGLVATFHVPTDREGVIWEVFEIRNGNIVPAQRFYRAVQDKDWWSSK